MLWEKHSSILPLSADMRFGLATPNKLSQQHRWQHPAARLCTTFQHKLPPKAVEVIAVVPLWQVGGFEVGIVGLLDKLMGLAAAKQVQQAAGGVTAADLHGSDCDHA